MSFVREHIVKRFTRSRGWRKVRNRHIKAYPQCAVCNRKKRLEVHHIKDFSEYPELELSLSNLITLCRPCHFLIGHLSSWKSINYDVIFDAMWLNRKIENRR